MAEDFSRLFDSGMEKRGTSSPRCCCNVDNIETHHVINIISTMLLADDNMIDMEPFNRTGKYVYTEIIVSNKDKKE